MPGRGGGSGGGDHGGVPTRIPDLEGDRSGGGPPRGDWLGATGVGHSPWGVLFGGTLRVPGLLHPGVAAGCSRAAAGPHRRPAEDLAGLREAQLLLLAPGLVGLDSEPRRADRAGVVVDSPGGCPEELVTHCTEGRL